jgi:hypothetical protein
VSISFSTCRKGSILVDGGVEYIPDLAIRRDGKCKLIVGGVVVPRESFEVVDARWEQFWAGHVCQAARLELKQKVGDHQFEIARESRIHFTIFNFPRGPIQLRQALESFLL